MKEFKTIEEHDEFLLSEFKWLRNNVAYGVVVWDDLTNSQSVVLQVLEGGVILDNDYLSGARHLWEINKINNE